MKDIDPFAAIFAILICIGIPMSMGYCMISYIQAKNHNQDCICTFCRRIVDEDKLVYMNKAQNLYYYDKISGQYIEVMQDDGTNYTYDEYLQKQLEEVQ